MSGKARQKSGVSEGQEGGSVFMPRFFFGYFLCSNDKESNRPPKKNVRVNTKVS